MAKHTRRKTAGQSPPERAPVGPNADPQQLRFYALEREEIGARDYARLTIAKCKQVARSVCRAYHVPQAQVSRAVLERWAAEWTPRRGIYLSKSIGTATDLLTILHELAHHVHYWSTPAKAYNTHQDHGPEFVACYLSILEHVRLMPRDALATVLERRGLKYLMPGPSPTTLRKVLRCSIG